VELLKQPGSHVWVADAPAWTGDPKSSFRIGIWKDGIQFRADKGLSWQLGQMYGVVGPGLIFAQHVFQGLRRDMYVREDKEAAKAKFAVTWTANRDCELVGDKTHSTLKFTDPPPNRVFVVYISPNRMLTEFPDIFGWAEHWTWVGADSELKGAPVDHNARYDRKVWSREE
jgi:hypothetical protein